MVCCAGTSSLVSRRSKPLAHLEGRALSLYLYIYIYIHTLCIYLRTGVGGSTDAVDASPSLHPSLAGLEWKTDPAQATMSDILRVHEYPYVAHLQTVCKWVGLR